MFEQWLLFNRQYVKEMVLERGKREVEGEEVSKYKEYQVQSHARTCTGTGVMNVHVVIHVHYTFMCV